jgi:hypothetical protein
MIYCLGDSHRDIFVEFNKSLNKEVFAVGNIEHTLAYNLYNKMHNGWNLIGNCLKRINEQNPKILMVFGEIDCRCHIVKQAKLQNISIEESTKKVVDNYITGIKRLLDIHYNVSIWGPVASANYDSVLHVHNLYPWVGTDQERNLATKIFNEYCESCCKKLGIGFFSIFKNLVDENNKTIDVFYKPDRVHLNEFALPYIHNCLRPLIGKI